MERRSYFIVNPHSSNGRTGHLWPEIHRRLERQAGPIRFDYTLGTLHAAELAARALREGCDLIMAVGGDGTINEVLNGFFVNGGTADAEDRPVNPEAVLGYLCSGTGGDLSRSLSYHDCRLERQVDRLLHGTVRRLDYGRAEFRDPEGRRVCRRFINAASMGFSGNVVHAVNRIGKLFGGKAAYLLGVLQCLIGLSDHPLTVRVDGREFFQGPALLVTVANGRYFGGSMMIAPQARLDDGLLDLVVIRGMTRRRVLAKIGSIYRGEHMDLPEVAFTRGQEIEVTSDRPVLLEMDGEQPGWLDARFRVVPEGVPLLCTAESPISPRAV